MDAVHAKFIVEMRACCEASAAHITDNLPLFDTPAITCAAGKAIHMGVECAVAATVFNDDSLAIAAFSASKNNSAVSGSLDWGPSRCGIVHALMCPDFVQDGVFSAQTEPGTDSSEVDRRAQELFAHAFAIRAVVISSTFAIRIAHGPIRFPPAYELGSQDFAIFQLVSI